MEQNSSETSKQVNCYENSKVYRLSDADSGYFYTGSTCDRLSEKVYFCACSLGYATLAA